MVASYLPFMARWLNSRISIALPIEEFERIKKYPEIKWGAVGRKLIIEYLNQYEKVKENMKEIELEAKA